ncbi:MAG: hypothetical protein HC886_05825 [Leptolyngbyaceae cyanobacterium SM1_1_3]|nr:hypothetical protein [Leptolyngbyaceae cyanobacterium SM1_1_3]NJM84899.1 hypothetical protein [Leptolyngbyaceae cyanobacterium RM2_2_21]NJN05015.1 hypothetical protein [Leptolyngbyaceae cyanobacterium RM1_1_2]NJO09589.1 hypothetical protein [Leptolyngbyaceae cyanobacterium SL_1_1]
MAWATEVDLGTDFADGSDPDPNDWALVKLDRPLGDRYGTLQWQALPANVLLNSKNGTTRRGKHNYKCRDCSPSFQANDMSLLAKIAA